jgi:hypothetical protein
MLVIIQLYSKMHCPYNVLFNKFTVLFREVLHHYFKPSCCKFLIFVILCNTA